MLTTERARLHRTLLAGKTGLEQAKKLVISYKQGDIKQMTPDLWRAKKIVDSTLHPGMEIAAREADHGRRAVS